MVLYSSYMSMEKLEDKFLMLYEKLEKVITQK